MHTPLSKAGRRATVIAAAAVLVALTTACSPEDFDLGALRGGGPTAGEAQDPTGTSGDDAQAPSTPAPAPVPPAPVTEEAAPSVAPGTTEPATGAPDTPTGEAPTPGAGGGAGSTGAAGSVPVGTADYPVPANALFVSPAGADSGNGSQGQPWRTVRQAIKSAPNGSTVVLRAGSYHESVTIPAGKRLTLQAYPGEAVWFDGSREVSGWAGDGSVWRAGGWTEQFDRSPTYTAGAADGTTAGWTFVNPAHPLAAYPEQVFVDGVAQRQVASRGEVVAGTFYVDTGADALYLGTDPAGKSVRASALTTGLTVRGAGSVVRGIGVQRYATPVPEKGAVRALAADVVLENLVVRDNATQGIFVGGRGQGVRNTIRLVTVERSGLLGVESSYADGLVVDRVRSVGNNTERFNSSPVSGGMKITRARGLTVVDSEFSANLGVGLWFDESVYDATVTGNDVVGNTSHGISFEISSKALFADNVVADNGAVGMKINNASNVDIWNNTVVDNADRPMWLVQDSRVASDLSTAGHDPRQQLPDPTVTWLLGPVQVSNNVIGGTTRQNCLLCVQDSSLRRSAAQIGVTADGNAYHRSSGSVPRWTVTWPVGKADPLVFTSLRDFRAHTGQEANGAEFSGTPLVDEGFGLTGAAVGQETAIAQPLPAEVAAAIGGAAGQESLGADRG